MKAFSFVGSGSEYFKIWIVNVLLTIVTFGLYYPWAKVRNRRYLYANSTLDGRNFEYHATGKQLFLSYLIAMILFIAYIVIQKVSPIGSLLLIIVFFAALPWIILKSMSFNMKMSTFSNVRFDFLGKSKEAYLNYFVYPLALYLGFIILVVAMTFSKKMTQPLSSILILILFFGMFYFVLYMLSYMKKKNSEFFINNSRYGQGEFKTNIEIKQLMSIRLKTVGVALLSAIVAIIFVGVIAYGVIGVNEIQEFQYAMDNPDAKTEQLKVIFPLIGAVYLMILLAVMVAIAYSFTKHREYIYANTILDNEIEFKSTLEAMPYAWILVSNLILVIITLGFAFPWAKVRVAKTILENTYINAQNGLDGYLTQKEEETSSLGDQIGDAFDIDIGIGF